VAQGGFVSAVLYSLIVNDMPAPSRHMDLAEYADDTAILSMSSSASLLVGYVEAGLDRFEHWLWDWRIAMNVLKSIAMHFAKTANASSG
jgi:hypothetical protein